jgi:type IV fimbrial biogenesis protein FimT
MSTNRQHGFTLWELLMTMLVAGIMLGIGVPNVMEMQRNGRMTAATNDLITAIVSARAEAVKRQMPTSWCFTDDVTAASPRCLPTSVTDSVQGAFTVTGFFTWVDDDGDNVVEATDGNAVVDAGETVLTRGVAPGLPTRYSGTCGHVTFSPTGFRRQVGTLCGTNLAAARVILLCDDRGRRVANGGLSSARIVRIDRVGRPAAMSESTQVNNVITGSLNPLGINPTCP